MLCGGVSDFRRMYAASCPTRARRRRSRGGPVMHASSRETRPSSPTNMHFFTKLCKRLVLVRRPLPRPRQRSSCWPSPRSATSSTCSASELSPAGGSPSSSIPPRPDRPHPGRAPSVAELPTAPAAAPSRPGGPAVTPSSAGSSKPAQPLLSHTGLRARSAHSPGRGPPGRACCPKSPGSRYPTPKRGSKPGALGPGGMVTGTQSRSRAVGRCGRAGSRRAAGPRM
jgi:hypothetical protein